MPIDSSELKRAIKAACHSLEQVTRELSSIAFPYDVNLIVNLSHLNEYCYIENELRGVPAGYAKEFSEIDFIYVFKLIDASDIAKKKLVDLFEQKRATQDSDGKKDYCRNNGRISDYLYVGRSQKLRSRLKQHLGSGSKGIFAMHMQRWATPVDCHAEISYFRFDSRDNLLIQALEDGLWQNFNPMFGRKGEK